MTEQVDPLVAEALEVASILTDMRAPLSIKAAAILRTQAERIAALTQERRDAVNEGYREGRKYSEASEKRLGVILDDTHDRLAAAEARLADALAALKEVREIAPAIMTALMATKGRDDLLLSHKMHQLDASIRATLSRLTAGEKKGGEHAA